MTSLTHLDAAGAANMVDVADKNITSRMATAEGKITLNAKAMDEVLSQQNKKGDVISVARIAGIMAAKQTSTLIPLCHTLLLSKVKLEFDVQPQKGQIVVSAMVKCEGKTGVEMEALTAVSIACLTLFDMCKAVDPNMIISNIKVLTKHGGKSGDWQHQSES